MPTKTRSVTPAINSWRLIARVGVAMLVIGGSSVTAEQPAEPTAAARLLAYQQHALTAPGDPGRGQQLFFDEQRTKCVVCHKVGNRGADVGPDLSHIGGKYDRPHLIESLLEPSRQIVEGFRSTMVVTGRGRIVTGIIRSRSPEAITLVDVEARLHTLPLVEIAEQADSSVSLMPEGLAELVSIDQFADLIAFLESLRPGGKAQFGADVSGPIALPAGFDVTTVATGLTGATALEAAPDGRLFVCEQVGRLRVVKDGRLLEEPFVTLPVDQAWERGLIGVTVHPEFPRVPFVYLCYVAAEPYPHHRVSRFKAVGNRAEPGSEQILLEGDDQRTLGGKVPAGHQGGAVHFGPDGKLYVAIGEQTAETPSQHLNSLQGKLLRLDPDGGIPADNPFVQQATGKYRSIWAVGLRNPFTFAFRRSTGEMLINDVGGKFEEINPGVAGANYGWPVVDHGHPSDAHYVGAVHIYPQASISGGDFCPDEGPWPAAYRGRYFFADFVHGWIKTLDREDPRQAEAFASALRRPVDLRFAPDGSLYVLLRNAWVIDDKFQGGTSSLLRIRYRPPAGP